MSLYSLRINNDFNNKIMVVADFPHMNEARHGITQWAESEFPSAHSFEVGFISHDSNIAVCDLVELNYMSIKVL